MSRRAAVVFGAGSGIGAATAVVLGAAGDSVVCADLNLQNAERTAASIVDSGGSALALHADVTSSVSVDEAMAKAAASSGTPRAVVCTPGINVRKPLVRLSDEDFESITATNLRGTFNVLRAAGNELIRGQGGAVVVVASISASAVEPGQAVYAATKAGIVQMVRVFAAEVARYGVRANVVSPGPVKTPLTQPILARQGWADQYAQRITLGRWAEAEEIARPIAFLLSDEASYVNGENLFVHGGWMDLDRWYQDEND